MKKIILMFGLICFLLSIFCTTAFAVQEPNMSISILSPKSVEGYPGLDQTITAEIKNNTDKPIDDVMAYITMADLNKHMTVNLEDYSADKPIIVGTLSANETKTVELPIRLVYVSKFYLYITVVSSTSTQIVSSNAISVQILGNTMIDKGIVQIVAIITPVVVLVFVILMLFIRKKKLLKG